MSYNKFRGLGKRMRELLELLEFSVLQSEAGGHEYALFAAAIPSRDGPSGAYWGRFGGRAADTDSTQISSDVALKDVFEMYIAMRFATG